MESSVCISTGVSENVSGRIVDESVVSCDELRRTDDWPEATAIVGQES